MRGGDAIANKSKFVEIWERLVIFRGLTPRTTFKSEESAETSLSRAIFANALQLLVI